MHRRGVRSIAVDTRCAKCDKATPCADLSSARTASYAPVSCSHCRLVCLCKTLIDSVYNVFSCTMRHRTLYAQQCLNSIDLLSLDVRLDISER